MKQEDLHQVKKRLRIILVAIVIAGFYFAGIFGTIGTEGGLTSNPITMIMRYRTNPYPWSAALILITGLICVAIYEVIKMWRDTLYEDGIGRNFHYSRDSDPYGQAHFAQTDEYKDIAQIRSAERATGIILGQLPGSDDGSECIDFHPPRQMNGNIFAVGSSGSGKTWSFIKPYILQTAKCRESMIITDPKGELYEDMAGYLEDHGYIVRRFDTITPEKSDGWDCLAHLKDPKNRSRLEVNAEIFAKTIINNIGDANDIYGRSSEALLKALILYIILAPNVTDEKKNIRTLNSLLDQGNVSFYEGMFETGENKAIEPALRAYRSCKEASGNLFGNVITHLKTGMNTIQSGIIEDILSRNDINMELPGEKPCAYFCRFAATHDTYQFVVALFFSNLFITLMDAADKKKGKKLDVPVHFVMDEFANIGTLPSYDRMISVIRSYGITAVMAVQDITQFENNYPTTATTIRSNCGTFLNIGVNDPVSAKFFQDRLGECTVEVTSSSSAIRTLASERESVGTGRRSLMTLAEIQTMSSEEMLIIFQRKQAIYCHKFPVNLHPEFPKLRQIVDEDVPDFDDRRARSRKFSEEAARVAAWEKAHPKTQNKKEPEKEWATVTSQDLRQLSPFKIFGIIVKDDINAIKQLIAEKKTQKTEAPKENEAGPVQPYNPLPILEFDDGDIFDGMDEEEEIGNRSEPETVPAEKTEKKKKARKEKEPEIENHATVENRPKMRNTRKAPVSSMPKKERTELMEDCDDF